MKPRTLTTKNDYLEFGQTVLQGFATKKYKSSEDYVLRYQTPIWNPQSTQQWIANKNVEQLRAVAIRELTQRMYRLIPDVCIQVYGESPQRIAVGEAVLQITKHGECGTLADGLSLYLMKIGFPDISRLTIDDDGLHAFVVISDPTESIRVAIDPFFNLCCFLDDYKKHPTVLRFGRAVLGDADWKPSKFPETVYSAEIYNPHLVNLQNQVSRLVALSKHESIMVLSNYLNYMLNLNHANFDLNQVTTCMRFCLTSSLDERGLTPKEIAIVLDEKLPLEKPKAAANPSPLFPSSPHDALVRKIEALVAKKGKGMGLLSKIKDKNYGSALRTACNDKDGYDFVQCMLAFKDDLKLQLDEKAGEANMCALDYAAKHADKKIYQLLVQHGAKENVKAPQPK